MIGHSQAEQEEISNQGALVMDEAESAQTPYEDYYQSSPLGFLNDSYFTQPQDDYQQYGHHQIGNPGQFGLGIEYTTPVSPFSVSASHQLGQRQDQMDPNLLSAEMYQERTEEHTNPEREGTENTQLYMGFLASNPRTPSPMASVVKSRRAPKKNPQKSAAAEDKSTRQRGRPRLVNHDQNAAERRRTQIRLAQRAYRQRKETTISGLRKRVSSLEKTIEDMHKTFVVFNDRAIASGIQGGNPALAKQLETAAEHLADLAKNSAHESDAEDDEHDVTLSAEMADGAEQSQLTTQQTVDGTRSDHVPMLGYESTIDVEADDDDGEIARKASAFQAPLESLPLSDWTATEVMQRSQIDVRTIDGTPNNTVGQLQQYAALSSNAIPCGTTNNVLQYTVPVRGHTAIHDNFQFGGAQLVTRRPADTPSPEGKTLLDFMTLPLPMSYSFQEASFARRLMRISLETAYRLMTDPCSRREDLKRLCRFTWCFTSSSRIVDHLKGLIERTTEQNLEFWEVPALHLGGAGMHYPRVGIDAGCAPAEWWANKAPTGPPRPSQPETSVPDAIRIEQTAEWLGLEGEWFDPNDVEQYLQSKGLYLDGQSSLVELNSDTDNVDESFPGSNDMEGSSASSPATSSPGSLGPRNPDNTELTWPDDPILQGAGCLWNEENANMPEILGLDMDFSFDETLFPSPTAFAPDVPGFNILPNIMPTINPKVKKFVDVDKFLDGMVQSAVCLGRAPGFRRAAVDSALMLATTDGF